MSVVSWVVKKTTGLPPARVRGVTVERDLEVKMPDGEVLLADRWFAPPTVGTAPIVLLRSPYGRRQLGVVGRIFAGRGYQCLIQSCRGTFGSGGTFDPFHYEHADGTATLEWLSGQSWFTGSVGTFGPSYLGLTQWALAADPPDFLQGMALGVTAATVRDTIVYPGGSFSLETGGAWVDYLEFQERPIWTRLQAMATAPRRMAPVYTSLPLGEVDRRALGRRIDFYQDWLEHEQPGDPWWEPFDYSRQVARVPPAALVGGWFDIFLPGLVDDFVRLCAASRPARLTIGPWTHTSAKGGVAAIIDALDWFDTHLPSRPAPVDPALPVRLYVMGRDEWVELPDWPPPAQPQRWHLHPGGILDRRPPDPAAPDRYRYDPADPTPGVGGPSLDMRNAGPRVQRRREERRDVLSYTTAHLPSDLTVAGPITAEIWLGSSHPHVDMFVRLCHVDADGTSRNLSDGILRLDPTVAPPGGDGVRRVRVAMWPTAMTFRRGHRLRLQVSSGAHPLFARNTGSGERLGAATTLVPADVQIWHDPEHPSGIDLPVSAI
jgi:hypothetical protein